jgi:hypothetical protein
VAQGARARLGSVAQDRAAHGVISG